MGSDPDIAAVAELMSSHRGPLLGALMGGSELSAGALAERVGISRSLASNHLSKLLDGGLVAVTQTGRARHYRIANDEVADAVEAVGRIAPATKTTGLREAERGHAIRRARTCYDHFAGVLGVELTAGLERAGVIEDYSITDLGAERLAAFGLDLDALRAGRRVFARPCIDWTEQRPHLAGALGAAITQRAFDLHWVHRIQGGRALKVTTAGEQGLAEMVALASRPVRAAGA